MVNIQCEETLHKEGVEHHSLCNVEVVDVPYTSIDEVLVE